LRGDPIQQKFPKELGILFQIDPFVYFPTDFHLYAYVQNNPVNRVDPKGLESGEFGGLGGSNGTNTSGNGNFGGGFRDQDDKCSSITSFMNKQYCKRECCKAHDRCYKQHRCNASSWIGSLTGANGQCNSCNSTAASCIIKCDCSI
jgi:hypothetical protein